MPRPSKVVLLRRLASTISSAFSRVTFKRSNSPSATVNKSKPKTSPAAKRRSDRTSRATNVHSDTDHTDDLHSWEPLW
ncbi:hypothetical protein QBC32DRAFT_351781 [Pseudoneurospora amorphoporcata]|uniref:Uncharacterized protein n=1 Tax=Pseudoneurospora amorphoporcata TaxID=241081 RepID=A0AAN6SCQ8_9PEZI|nr:hypothetical protein QBC32DRAFT_351781 [Pseudoneurospora amorphoporcata]